jgi:methionine aminotransferase
MDVGSKFPQMQTTIFTEMGLLAREHKAINLGQGFPNFEPHPYLFERYHYYLTNGHNQYAPMMGVSALRDQIVKLHKRTYGVKLNKHDEITITSGATEGVFCAISALIGSGDEIIMFDPAFDSYVPNVELNGGVAVHVELDDHYRIDWNRVADKITDKTKAILINTPHNPCGTTLTESDLDSLWNIIENKNIFIISDEVYQHIIFDGHKHLSPFNDVRMRDRTLAVSSFGKTFHVTGWKVGYVVASKELSAELRKIHQYITFCTHPASQMAIADMMEKFPNYYADMAKDYTERRDFFAKGLNEIGLKTYPVEGSYFQMIDYSPFSTESDKEFAIKLTKEGKVTGIPISVFYETPPQCTVLRFCFAKTYEVLEESVTYLDKYLNK